ncbi:MAG: tetratricopeptide repeat protein [Myxococcales bacterium]|nr:tetratricopeptide repeat protein [Myxococcales bacterium]
MIAGAGAMMRGLAALVVLVALLLVPAGAARAETVAEAYKKAIAQFQKGKYQAAVDELEKIAAIPTRHEDVYYNLGNAYFRLNKLGKAIYNYERSLQVAEREDARYNLETARALAQSRTEDVLKGAEREAFWVRAVTALRARPWALLFGVCWWLFFGLLLLARRRGGGALRAAIIAGAVLFGVASGLFGTLLAGRVYVDNRVQHAIVLPDSASVRELPNSSARKSFTVHAGLKVRTIAADSGWLRVRLANGLEGWLPKRQLGRL